MTTLYFNQGENLPQRKGKQFTTKEEMKTKLCILCGLRKLALWSAKNMYRDVVTGGKAKLPPRVDNIKKE